MTYAIYIIAFNLGLLAFLLARLIDRGAPIGRPFNQAPMRLAARLGIACVLALTAFGFWKLPWYLPLLAYLSVAITAGTIGHRASRSVRAPGIVITLAAASVLLSALLVAAIL
mgnify:CR=1 FL=1